MDQVEVRSGGFWSRGVRDLREQQCPSLCWARHRERSHESTLGGGHTGGSSSQGGGPPAV